MARNVPLVKRIFTCLLAVLLTVEICGCGNSVYEIPYDAEYDISNFNTALRENAGFADSFASNLCIVTSDVTTEGVDTSSASAAVLFDVSNAEVLYAVNAHERLYPASITKIMTALVALKYGSVDQVLTATDTVNINESGAQLLGLEPGDTMTLNQALHILLIYSANDVAMLIAENISGSVDDFVDLMNEEAAALGATNTHFTNPHGLTDTDHYTTAYDLYLIFNEVMQYDLFQEIIHMTDYETTYYDADNEPVSVSVSSTDRLLHGDYSIPSRVTIVGGKTGTTNAAGHCLILLTRDINGAQYISVILGAASNDELYEEMIDLLGEIQ